MDKVKVMEAGDGGGVTGGWVCGCGGGEETEWPRRRLSPMSSVWYVQCMVCAQYVMRDDVMEEEREGEGREGRGEGRRGEERQMTEMAMTEMAVDGEDS